MKKTFWILLIIIGCKGKNENKKLDCNYSNWKVFSIYETSATIKVPELLIESNDSSVHIFEYDSALLYTRVIASPDSLSSVFIKARVNPLPNSMFVEYSNDVVNHYKSSFQYSGSSASQQIDTSEENKLFKFSFLGNRDSNSIAFGGAIFNIDKIRFEILINLNSRNFDSLQNKLNCALESLTINKRNH